MNEMQANIPAPGRDLKNVPPHVPPASREASPLTRWALAGMAIILGAVMMIMALAATVFQLSPGSLLRSDQSTAWILIGCSGLLFTLAGVGILRQSLLLTIVTAALALVCGWTAAAMS